jgi:hypothetical protein
MIFVIAVLTSIFWGGLHIPLIPKLITDNVHVLTGNRIDSRVYSPASFSHVMVALL